MASTESLELLARVIDRLEPLGSMTPGEPLRADHWNALVSSIADLARLGRTLARASRRTA